MNLKLASAAVPELRQETQFTCCAASIAGALQAHGKAQTEAEVNTVLQASPFRGASWEGILATLQYFGMRGHLIVPCTVAMLKEATDRQLPVVIAWNPRNRPWSHASVVFDVTGEPGNYSVHVMDPNLANPSKSVIVLDEDDFYSKWYEKVSEEILVRRPACIVEREVSGTGRQVRASMLTKTASEIFVDLDGMAFDDEGNRVNVGHSFPKGPHFPGSQTYTRLSALFQAAKPAKYVKPANLVESDFYLKWSELALLKGDSWGASFLATVANFAFQRRPLSPKQQPILNRLRAQYARDLNNLDQAIRAIKPDPTKVAAKFAGVFSFIVDLGAKSVVKIPDSVEEATDWAAAIARRNPEAGIFLKATGNTFKWLRQHWVKTDQHLLSKFATSIPSLQHMLSELSVLDELADHIEEFNYTVNSHYKSAALQSVEITTPVQAFEKAVSGLKAATEILSGLENMVKLFPEDKTAARALLDAQTMVNRYTRLKTSTREVVVTLSKKNMPESIKKAWKAAESLVRAKFEDPQSLIVTPWVGVGPRGTPIFRVFFCVLNVKEHLKNYEASIMEDPLSTVGAIDGEDWYNPKPFSPKAFADKFTDKLADMGWSGLKGSGAAAAGREALAKIVARAVSQSYDPRCYDKQPVVVSKDNRIVEGSYRTDLDKEGQHYYGEHDWHDLCSKKYKEFMARFESHLSLGYRKQLKKVDFYIGDKSWAEINITLN